MDNPGIEQHKKVTLWRLIPLFGCMLFLLLYVVATRYYPGGSQFDRNSNGFSWSQNYWCNLLNETAINGQPNGARPIALTAMAVLCGTLAYFWYLFPLQVAFVKSIRLVIQVSGFIAMAIALFLFTPVHDVVVNCATLFGLVALTGTFSGLKKLKWILLFRMGVFMLVLIAINNLFYYKKDLLYYLPVLQKATFLYFLLWISAINIRLYARDAAMAHGKLFQNLI